VYQQWAGNLARSSNTLPSRQQMAHCSSVLILFRNQTGGRRPRLRSRRDGKYQPCVPTVGTFVGVKLVIALQPKKALHIANRQQIPDLWSDAE
jgi:hypothetical protein